MDQRLPLSLTNRFVSRAEGLFSIDAQGKETRICEMIRHLGNAARADGAGAADIVEFLDRTGVARQTVLLHKDSVLHPRKMLESLTDQNFAVPEEDARRNQLVSYLTECRGSPECHFLLAHRMGWHGDAFVIGKDVIAADDTLGVRLDGPLARDVDKFGSGGTSAEYERKVLKRAEYSSRLMIALALAILPPLARIIGLPRGGGINFYGGKDTGKTTVLRVIGSFWGGGKDVEYYRTWSMTDNGPETLGLTHCDLPLLLDELDTLDPDPRVAAGRVKTMVQRLCAGQEKTRSHYAPSGGGPANDFRVIFASTSERRLTDFMREGGLNATGGLEARLFDVPADPGRGRKIFERLPKDRKTGKRITADKFLDRLNRACNNSYGVVGRIYLRSLVRDMTANRSALETFLHQEMAVFETEVANDPHVDHRVRQRFAALYAAGQYGLRVRILPPECNWFKRAIGSCYRDAVALIPRPSLSTADAAELLGNFLDNNRRGLFSMEGLTGKAFAEGIGVRPNATRHSKRVWLKTEVFNELFGGNHNHAAVLLSAAGIIVRSSAGLISRQQRVPTLKEKHYFYVIDPAKLSASRQKG